MDKVIFIPILNWILFLFQEGGSPQTLSVTRDGGALVQRYVHYEILNGESEFYGATNVLLFPPGVRSKTFAIAAKQDGIPEVHRFHM